MTGGEQADRPRFSRFSNAGPLSGWSAAQGEGESAKVKNVPDVSWHDPVPLQAEVPSADAAPVHAAAHTASPPQFDPPVGTAPLATQDARLTHPMPQTPDAGFTAGLRLRVAVVQASLWGFGRRLRLQDWKARFQVMRAHAHRELFDRRVERLLFYKTPPLRVYAPAKDGTEAHRAFVYSGPIPRKVLEWTFAALPSEPKHFAFVDFDAGNGRTLLLAAQHPFEFAAGCCYEAAGAAVLEMNLAQYPRSYLRCRDLHCLRAGRDGIGIPSEPAVLFFPDSLDEERLAAIVEGVAASYGARPRPLYLVFENAGRERRLLQATAFRRTRLPLANQAKMLLFSPAPVAVYSSPEAA